jgi:hypothetical protein
MLLVGIRTTSETREVRGPDQPSNSPSLAPARLLADLHTLRSRWPPPNSSVSSIWNEHVVRCTVKVKVKVRVTLRLAVYRQSVRPGTKPSRLTTRVFFIPNWTIAVKGLMQHPLVREDEPVVYNCCWSSPAQSISGPSPAELVTIFYCLRLETPPTWWARSPYLYPSETGWPSYTSRHWAPFSSPPTTSMITVEYSKPPPCGLQLTFLT